MYPFSSKSRIISFIFIRLSYSIISPSGVFISHLPNNLNFGFFRILNVLLLNKSSHTTKVSPITLSIGSMLIQILPRMATAGYLFCMDNFAIPTEHTNYTIGSYYLKASWQIIMDKVFRRNSTSIYRGATANF